MKKKVLIILGVVAAIVVAVVIFLFGGSSDVYIDTAEAKVDTVQTNVTATGYVQPVYQVSVGTQVSGVIEKIYVDFNSNVKKGQLLAELDKATLKEKLSQAKASLISSQSDLTYAQQSYDRTKQLFEGSAATQAAYDEATNRLSQAKSSVTNAEANLHQAEVNLSYAEIYSPIDGVVLSRDVDQGQTVAASFNTPTLFSIANDLKKMQVEADVDEADIGSVRVGQPVTFTVDSYAEIAFTGVVQQIRLQPTVTSNVVTYTVIIEAPNPEEKLFPGMTASVTIVTQNVGGVTVPVEALNFNPSEKVLKKWGPDVPAKKRGERSVYVMSNGKINKQVLKTGLTDGVNTIVTEGISSGDVVVLSASLQKKSTGRKASAANPLMPQRSRR